MPTKARHPDWQTIYSPETATQLPWHFSDLDPDLARELTERGLHSGRCLDIGTGSGSQAGLLARRGFAVTGTDISEGAIRIARAQFPGVTFVVDDIRESALRERFDLVFDRGCFHVLEPGEYQSYLRSLERILEPGGLLMLKCFSRDEGESEVGPVRFSREEIAEIFSPHFTISSLRPTVYQGSRPHQPKSWFGVLRKSRHSTIAPS